MGLRVGVAVDGTGVGFLVGETLGFAVEGTGVGFLVGETLGLFVGGRVGCFDGAAVGFTEG